MTVKITQRIAGSNRIESSVGGVGVSQDQRDCVYVLVETGPGNASVSR